MKEMKSGQEVYWLRVTLEQLDQQGRVTKIHRDIHVRPHHSLYQLAKAILVKGFGFYFDHPFGFYEDFGGPYKGKSYELFAEMEDCQPINPNAQGVSNVAVQDAFLPEDKMLFLFDYGDEWRFLVHCKGIVPATPGARYPQIVASKGQAPEQYPSEEDDEEMWT